MFRRGRGLRTSFNSTLLWKLQLPLSRLAPQPHPSASAPFATETTPAGLLPWKNPGELRCASCFEALPKPSHTCLSMCAYAHLICKTFYMHKKGTLRTFGEDKKPMRDQTSTYFYLFIIRVTLKSTEKLGRLGRKGDRDRWKW